MDILKAIEELKPKRVAIPTTTVQVTKRHKERLNKLHKKTQIPIRTLLGLAVDLLVDKIERAETRRDVRDQESNQRQISAEASEAGKPGGSEKGAGENDH